MVGLAGFDFQALNQKYLAQPSNDATGHGASIMRTKAMNAWRCIGIYHLTKEENAGRHNIYLECLDESGKRTNVPAINWTYTLDGPIQTRRLDKPADEPAADIPIDPQATITLWVQDLLDSDSVGNLHARHSDGSGWGHQSYFVVFQRQGAMMPPVEPPIEPTEPLTLDDHERRIVALERIVREWTGK